jgi:hypothetical protein
MLTLIKHVSGVLELVEAPEPPDPYHYFAPWEDDQIQTRADGTKFVEHDGKEVDVEIDSEEPAGTCYRALLGADPS